MEKLQQLKPREKQKRKQPVRLCWSSDSSNNIMEESEEEYIDTSEEEEEEEHCFSWRKANVCGSTFKEVGWVSCDLCEKWYHVTCQGACDEELASENYTCKLCHLV